jgi:hypothetical protein
MRRITSSLEVLERRIPALALGATLFLAGCGALDGLLSVDAPSQVVASDLEDPNAADLLVASVGNEFRCMWTHYVGASAMTGNELGEASSTTVLTIWDTRIHDTSGYGSQYASADCGSGQPALYLPLARTRWLGDQVRTSLTEWSDADVENRTQKIGEVALYTGYAYLLFAEAFCENEIAFDGGPRQSREATWNTAIARFDEAIASGNATAAAVGSVPVGFSWEMQYSNDDAVTRNKIWEIVVRDNEGTIEAPYRDVMFDGVPDPRIAVTDEGFNGVGSDIPIFTPDKYPDATSPHEVATWEEAQLIIAEAFARAGGAGDLVNAVNIINVLHANAGIPAFASTDQAEILTQIEYERQAEFFLEGHHLRDLQRFNQELFPAVGVDHPFGAFYGDEICFDLPAVEFLNNPSAS